MAKIERRLGQAGSLGILVALGLFPAAEAATARREVAGPLKDGRVVEAVTLRGANGVSARILAYGATLQSLVVPDRKGRESDIVLGHDTPAEYEATQDFF
ncbi:MAG: Aldose 1-epimerase precursor, partial [Pseudomonadota bacterium]